MIKLVAFDWNGTLFADTIAVYESNNGVFRLFNRKPVSFRTFQKYFDVPVKKYYQAVGIPEDALNQKATQITKTFHLFYESRVSKVRTRAWAKALLSFLSKNNINSVIFSNHIVDPIKKQLKRLKIEKYFSEVLANSHIQTSFEGRNKKEKLSSFIIDKKILPGETLIIGDTIEEIEIGKQLGCVTVAITHGNCSTVRLKSKKPDYLIYSLKQAINIIKKINL